MTVGPKYNEASPLGAKVAASLFLYQNNAPNKGYQVTLIRITEVRFIPRTRTLNLPFLSQLLDDLRRLVRNIAVESNTSLCILPESFSKA